MLRYVCAVATLLVFAPDSLAQRRPDPEGPYTVEAQQDAWERHLELKRAGLFKGLQWRDVGPVVQGGRIVDIAVDPRDPFTFYVAYASGGIWKTTNNGISFEPLSDDESTMIIGDMELDPNDPDRIFVGTGENNSQSSAYRGLGVFRSDDAGETWTNVGLRGSDRIGRVLVDPRDSNRVFVAALGKLYTPGGQRGVFRSGDGGDTWDQVLESENDVTGFIDLAFQPGNPDVIYAAAWERMQGLWTFQKSGEGSAIWRSTDGGDTWERLSGGLPSGDFVGRIGLAVTPADPQVLYASIDNQQTPPEEEWDLGDSPVTAKRLRTMSKEEFLRQDPEDIGAFMRAADIDPRLDAEKLMEAVRTDSITIQDLLKLLDDPMSRMLDDDIRGVQVWRSDDAGSTWRLMTEETIKETAFTFGWYFGQIRVAPDEADRVYVLGVPLLKSEDGGVTFEQIAGPKVHVDHHDLWINPDRPQHMILGNDGGLDMSYDGGESWLTLSTVSVGQFYTVSYDMATPYNIYGGLQDNGMLKGSSQTKPNISANWVRVGGGDGMWTQVDFRDNETIYVGLQFGNYTRRGPDGTARVKPRNGVLEAPLRYNWLTPILLSSHNYDVLYFGTNKLFRSMDKGETWTVLSDDLTKNENRGEKAFPTISVIDESELRFGLLWAGTDDGYVYVTRSSGAEWTEVSDGLPKDRWVSRIEASKYDENVAYVSLNGHRMDDITPYVYRTDDLGRTWKSISEGLPDEPVNVVREDPIVPNVLYVGTDRSVYVSIDTGETWMAVGSGLPNVPVHDLTVHPRERELIAGTHGRSVWVLDVAAVEDLTQEVRGTPVHVFDLEAIDFNREWRRRPTVVYFEPAGPSHLDVPFWVESDGGVEWSVVDSDGNVLRTGSVDAVRGVNVLRWDLLLDPELAIPVEESRVAELDDVKPADMPWAQAMEFEWPLYVTPGDYKIRIETAGGLAETDFVVNKPKRNRQ